MGEACGREATSLDPKNVGGYYWMAQNLGEHGSISKFYFLKRKKDFEKALRKAETLDNPQKPYDYSGINRTLAAYYTPRFMWGNLDKALEYAKTWKTVQDTSVTCQYWQISIGSLIKKRQKVCKIRDQCRSIPIPGNPIRKLI